MVQKAASAIYIRGIGARSSGQSIGLYVDNVPYLDKSAFDFGLNDIQLSSLTLDHQSLYGRNAMGNCRQHLHLSPSLPRNKSHNVDGQLRGSQSQSLIQQDRRKGLSDSH